MNSGDAKPRVLYIGVNRKYVNRTFDVLMRALHVNHDVSFYGPGYQPVDSVSAGPERWIDQTGPYDIVLFDHYTLMYAQIAARRKPFAGDVTHFEHAEFARYVPEMFRFLSAYRGRKCFVANWDVYGLEESIVENLESLDVFIIDFSMASETIAERLEKYESADLAESKTRGFWYASATDHWVNLVKRGRERVLQIPHSIGMDQFQFLPLAARRNRLCVPGTSYVERKRLYSLLSIRQRVHKVREKVVDKGESMLHTSLSDARMRAIHLRYDSEIASSQLAYTSGSVFRCPVRKYFEIPALGAVPIGQLVEGFSGLGFIGNENFLLGETPDDVVRIIKRYSNVEMQEVAQAAQRLVLRSHSEVARASQLAESFRKIIDGSFKGSYWKAGQYCHF